MAASSKVVDLDAMRSEVGPRPVKLGGRMWKFPGELPLYIVEAAQRGDLIGVAATLVGDDEADDLARLFDAQTLPLILTEVYGLDPEALASPTSSRITGKPRRPTSPGSTGRTSPKRSTARGR